MPILLSFSNDMFPTAKWNINHVSYLNICSLFRWHIQPMTHNSIIVEPVLPNPWHSVSSSAVTAIAGPLFISKYWETHQQQNIPISRVVTIISINDEIGIENTLKKLFWYPVILLKMSIIRYSKWVSIDERYRNFLNDFFQWGTGFWHQKLKINAYFSSFW